MQRRGEGYWREAIQKQAASGMSAAKFCRKHHLQRGTFLRWRKRLGDTGHGESEFVEVLKRTVLDSGRADSSLEVRVGSDIRIDVQAGADIGFVGSLIAAIRKAV
jgi:hypothetical protein